MFQTKSYHRCLRILPAILLAITCSSCGAEPKKGEAQQPEDAHRIAAPVSSANATEVAPKLEPVLEKVAATSPAEASVSLPNDANFTSTPFAATPAPPETARMEEIEIPNSRPLTLISCLTVKGQPVGYGTVFTENDISVTKFSGNKLAGLRIKLLPPAALDRPVGAVEIANVNAENKPVGPVYQLTPAKLIGDPFILSEVNAEGKPHGQHLQISNGNTYFSTSFENGKRSENTSNSKSVHTLATGERFFSEDRGPGRAHLGWQRTEDSRIVYRGLYVKLGHPSWEISFYGPDGNTEGDTIAFMSTQSGNLVVIIAPEKNQKSNGLGWKIHPGESIQYGEFAESIPKGQWSIYDKEIKVVSELTPFFAPIGKATVFYNKDGSKKTVTVGPEGLGAHL